MVIERAPEFSTGMRGNSGARVRGRGVGARPAREQAHRAKATAAGRARRRAYAAATVPESRVNRG